MSENLGLMGLRPSLSNITSNHQGGVIDMKILNEHPFRGDYVFFFFFSFLILESSINCSRKSFDMERVRKRL